jgi:hypothetical protein
MKPVTARVLHCVRLAAAFAVVVASGVMLVFAPTAGANHLEPAMAVSVQSKVTLVNRVYLIVPVSITCPDLALDENHFVQGESVSVSLTEKVSKVALASGSGGFGYNDERIFGGTLSGTPLACDGSPHAYSVNVFPDNPNAAGVPFKIGKAVASASVDIFVQDLTTFRGDDNRVNGGPTAITIRQ